MAGATKNAIYLSGYSVDCTFSKILLGHIAEEAGDTCGKGS
jgi:hypothetical protein